MKFCYTIHGAPRTKKNSQQILGFGRICPVCKKREKQFIGPSTAYKRYEKAALKQLCLPVGRDDLGAPLPVSTPVNMKCIYYMDTRRKVDLCNLLEATCDIFVAAGILADDNSGIVIGHDGSRVRYDKENPRVEVCLEDWSDE